MVKSLQALSDELPGDINKLEQTKSHALLQQQQQQAQLAMQQKRIYSLSTGSQTDGCRPKISKRVRTEKVMEIERQMNEDFSTHFLIHFLCNF
jgi:hypothetical protein